jgi:hypothetical protein
MRTGLGNGTHNIRLSALLGFVMLAACAHPDTVGPEDRAAWTTGENRASVQLVVNSSRWRQDAYEFIEMHVDGDRLDVTVRYGGGCREHEFALLVNPAFLESYPVQMHGVLAHDAKADACRALIQKTLQFDLNPLQRAYRAAYQTNTGRIHLRVAGWPPVVEYSF